MIPSRIVKRYICAWLSLDDERTLTECGVISGINVRTLFDVMYDRRATVRFDTADQILVRLGYQLAWLEDEELAHFYAAA